MNFGEIFVYVYQVVYIRMFFIVMFIVEYQILKYLIRKNYYYLYDGLVYSC